MVLYAVTTYKGDPKGFDDAVDELETQLELIDNANSVVFQCQVVPQGGSLWRAVIVIGQ